MLDISKLNGVLSDILSALLIVEILILFCRNFEYLRRRNKLAGERQIAATTELMR